jgi:dihydroorotase-like cyclic amidohydrolase
MWTPPSPEGVDGYRRGHLGEVEEDLCVAVDAKDKKATPFFDHDSGIIMIKGGTVVNDDNMEEADIIIEDGKITEVGQDLEVPSGAKIIDASDMFVMPGGIDTCTTLKGDGQLPLADDFASGTRAALAGGTTTVFDVVIPAKDESIIEAVAAWKDEIEASACCDVALTVVLPRWDDTIKADIVHLVKEEGINSFKVFMAYKDELMLSNEELLDVFDHCKSVGAVVHVHAENGAIIAENEKRLRAK